MVLRQKTMLMASVAILALVQPAFAQEASTDATSVETG